MTTQINGILLLAGLSATGPEAKRVDGTVMLAGVDSLGVTRLLQLNSDGTMSGGSSGSGSLPVGGTNAQFLRGDSTWSNVLNGPIVIGTNGVTLETLAAASLRIGAAPSATPIAQTLTIGESSRPATDTNVAGASGTLRSGLGTGAGTPAPLIFSAPVAVASGTTAQTYAEGIRVQGVGTAIGLGFFGHAAAVQASAYTPTNVSTDRSYDANATSIDELADVLGTLIADLKGYGLLA